MASVKMNSNTSTQPVIVGPATTSRMGLAIRKPMMVTLYQRGAWPKKFSQNAWVTSFMMLLKPVRPRRMADYGPAGPWRRYFS